MREIARDQFLLEVLSDRNSILDARMTRISIGIEEDILCADLFFDMSNQSEFKKIMIRAYGIKEVSFYHNEASSFYTIESYKFFRTGNNEYYLSLDPIDEMEIVSDEDGDFILSKGVVGFEL